MAIEFQFKRFYQFVWYSLYSNRKTLLYSSSLGIGIWALIFYTQTNLVRASFERSNLEDTNALISMQVSALQAALGFPMFTLGLWATSKIFKNLHNKSSNLAFLTLPVSSFEKWLSAWLLTGPLLALGFISLYFILVVVLSLSLGHLEFIDLFLTRGILKMIIQYLYLQPLFLIGAIYFRKNQFAKTWLFVFIGGFIIANIFMQLFFTYNTDSISFLQSQLFINGTKGLLSHPFIISLSLLMLAFSYFLFQRKQA